MGHEISKFLSPHSGVLKKMLTDYEWRRTPTRSKRSPEWLRCPKNLYQFTYLHVHMPALFLETSWWKKMFFCMLHAYIWITLENVRADCFSWSIYFEIDVSFKSIGYIVQIRKSSNITVWHHNTISFRDREREREREIVKWVILLDAKRLERDWDSIASIMCSSVHIGF